MPAPPTTAQHNHRFYERVSDFDRFMNDMALNLSDFFGIDGGYNTSEREQALGAAFGPGNVAVGANGVGYATDGVTTLYDDDGDGAWDSALQTGTDGNIYQFGPQGWYLY